MENSKRLGLEIIFPNYLVMWTGVMRKSGSRVDDYIRSGSQVEQAWRTHKLVFHHAPPYPPVLTVSFMFHNAP